MTPDEVRAEDCRRMRLILSTPEGREMLGPFLCAKWEREISALREIAMKSYCTINGAAFCNAVNDRCFHCPEAIPEQQAIDEIFAIRVQNNVPWKRLMEIALKHAPEETRAVLREINANDRKISDLLGELAK